MRILVVLFSLFLLNGCFIYSSNEAWEKEMEMYKKANGRSICIKEKYNGRVYIMYYCENGHKNSTENTIEN